MTKHTTIGLDLAKNVFHVVGLNEQQKLVSKKMLKRAQVKHYFANLEPCVVGMESCATSHYWAREIEQHGHTVKLIPPQYVKAFLRGNKNDYNDALAIAEAVVKPEMRFVAVKTQEQQDLQALHRMRNQAVRDRTALTNQMRGLLAEYGIVLPQGIYQVRKRIPLILEDAENGLSAVFRRALELRYEQLQQLDTYIDQYTQEIESLSQQNDHCKLLETIPGFGPIVASAFVCEVGNGSQFKRGRDVSASLGLVPKQNSSGGKDVLLGISKRGNGYLRGLLIHGARSVLIHAAKKEDKLSRWVMNLERTRGKHKAIVALANKLARIGWSVLHHQMKYQAA